MGAVNRCLKHPLARDAPVCLLAVLGAPRSGKTELLNRLLQGLPGLATVGSAGAGGWARGWAARAGHPLTPSSARQEAGAPPGCSWGADSADRGVRVWSHPFLLGKEGREVREGPAGPGWGREVAKGRRREESGARTRSGAPGSESVPPSVCPALHRWLCSWWTPGTP